MSEPKSYDDIKRAVKELTERKKLLDKQKQEMEFHLEKFNEELSELEPKIQELFGTTDKQKLDEILQNLHQEAERIIKEADEVLESDEL